MGKSLRVAVYDDRYPTSFVTPRSSRHTMVRKRFLPFNLVSTKLEGITLIEPDRSVDLVHAFNRIPLNSSKFIISFESHLPRQFALRRNGRMATYMRSRIAGHACRRIIALSHFARRCFLSQHADYPDAGLLADKLIVRHPSIVIPAVEDAMVNDSAEELILTFVGAHFGRKGGCVAVKIAEKAMEQNLPIRINIVSSLQVGGHIWTDPTSPGFFDPYIKLLGLKNVRHHGALPNDAVRQLLRNSHFGILATFGDTFGYSALESMSEHTPVLGTKICALPEFLEDGVNGISLPVKLNDVGDWWSPGYDFRGDADYARYFRDEVERLATEAVARLTVYIGQPNLMAPLRREARRTAETMFASGPAGEFLDALYDRVAMERSSDPAQLDSALDTSSPLFLPHASSPQGTAIQSPDAPVSSAA
ncbi:glycosyltransferase family 4 protein [Mesorhizobium sp. VK25A]|uniref:Glycosyltransferase family 4 protein n=1 Tax=Mesorhizobium vachelliae TaxID=3072309 RepID=A0ABU5A5N3_9HYPH|nr:MULTISPECIES: glycosyltransferase family 4 protein [unclassified Mesorhizobium]MDX8532973.1 glycosyltransferase family 4 protein [Mesorhizobium sp. VK25D]MDX8544521.1 glycosyltransferase family 4 protein [Mesorhizobium sp. VK25A]